MRCLARNILTVLIILSASAAYSGDYAAQRERVLALGGLTNAPVVQSAEGIASSNGLKAVFFDALDWQGKPTKVFAWLGLPKNVSKPVPGIVLVHGGGGTAYAEWVEKWNQHGFAAIAISVEGQTDEKVENKQARYGFSWKRHEWAGPERKGIYGDTDEPLKDQWMYHAVADTILANSLLRSMPEVNADKVGLMGISWGGVIASTTMGIDNRFAFAIPTYGCGDLANAVNKYGDALRNNEVYKQVWDPMLYLNRAKMPALWLSWPEDTHFSPIRQAACYHAMSGPFMVSLIPGMKHSHPHGWNPPDSYAFAQSVVETGSPWCRQTELTVSGDECRVSFDSSKPFDRAVLVSTTDDGFTGNRKWIQTPAELKENAGTWIASATLPPGTTAWFINVRSGNLTASSEFQEVTESKKELRISQQEQDYVRNNIAADKLDRKIQKIPARELAVRGGLPNFFEKARKRKPVTVAYFGGSITAHPGWRTQSFEGLQKMFPKSRMTMVNASVGGTGSIVGVFRADHDLLPCNPDLVFIEFAVNDGSDAIKRTKDVVRALEGTILKLRRQNPDVDICFFYTMQGKDVETVTEGFAQPAVSVHEQVASWYNLPSVYVGPAVADLVKSGKAVFKGTVVDKTNGTDANGKLVLTEDNTHPVIPVGHESVYADVALKVLKQLSELPDKTASRTLPVPMLGTTWEKATTIPVDGNAAFSGNWEKLTAENGPGGFRFGKKFYDWFPYLYRTEEPGASVTIHFKGTIVGVKGVEGPDSGIVKIKVDDQPETEKNYFTVYNHWSFYAGDVLPELEDGEHTVTWTLSDKPVDKGQILASYYKKDNDRDFREHPENYKPNRFSVGQIQLIGEILPPNGSFLE